VALSRCAVGTDCDFGALTRELGKAFMKTGGNLLLFHAVTNLKKEKDGRWLLTIKKNDLGAKTSQVRSRFVFVGAGGWALPLLQKSKIPEIRGFMGFPISGEFLVCQNPEVVDKHPNKVYGKAAIGAPPMSVPHLDKRIISKAHAALWPFCGLQPAVLEDWIPLGPLQIHSAAQPHPCCGSGAPELGLDRVPGEAAARQR